MSEKQRLLDLEETRWRELCARLDAISDWQIPGVNGEWSVKDVVAHIAAWHAFTTDRLEVLRATGSMPEVGDIDAFNANIYEECKHLAVNDVRAMSAASRHRFREEVAIVPEPLDERMSGMIQANAHGHYDEHLPDLDRFMARA